MDDDSAVEFYRRMLPDLKEPVVFLTSEGVRYTFLPPGNAYGCSFQDHIELTFKQTTASAGVKNSARIGFLWPVEAYVYAIERSRIIGEILSGLRRAPVSPRAEKDRYDVDPRPEDFGDVWGGVSKAIDKSNARHGRKPKLAPNRKFEIRKLGHVWWLLHREWLPLCFDSFEEAVAFAKHYMVRPRVS